MADLNDPTDDAEAARFADDLIAITNAQRAVVEAAMAWCAAQEAFDKRQAASTIGGVITDWQTNRDQLIAACRALRLTKAVLG